MDKRPDNESRELTGQGTLDARVSEHYAQQRLSDERTQRILAATDIHRRTGRVWLRRMAAAIAVLAIGFGVLHVQLERRDQTTVVLREIALNHREDHGADVYASTYADLADSLDRLTLPASLPEEVGKAFEVVGGRYCSVRGRLAAKVMLRHSETGDYFSLFATGRTPALQRIGQVQVVTDGVDVRLWSDEGTFFALAASVES